MLLGAHFYNYIFTTHVFRSLCRLHLWRSKNRQAGGPRQKYKNELYRVIHPNAILPVRVNGKAISHEIVSKILAFILVYVMVLIAGSIILSALGLSMEEAFGSTLSCLSNIGPGAGSTGPAGNYAFIPDLGKWTLSIIMLIGRLELFTVLILFTSYFWKTHNIVENKYFCTFVSNLKSKAKYSHNMPTTDLEENKIKQAQPEEGNDTAQNEREIRKTYLKMNV